MASLRIWLFSALFLALVNAQNDDPFASLLSDIASIATSLATELLDATTTTQPSTSSRVSSRTISTSASSTSSRSSSSTTTSSRSSTTSASSGSSAAPSASTDTSMRTVTVSRDVNSQLFTNSASNSAGSSAVGNAAASATSSPSATGGSSNKAGIIAGAVVGAVVLIALILLLLFCCRRRRRRRRRRGLAPIAKSRSRSPSLGSSDIMSGGGVESKAVPVALAGSNRPEMTTTNPVRPNPETSLSGETIYTRGGPTNPFVPLVPPPRRSVFDQDEPLALDTARAVRGNEAAPPGFNPLNAHPPTPQSTHHGHSEGALAAGAMAGVVGTAAAMHHHNNRKSQEYTGDDRTANMNPDNNQPAGYAISRKPVSRVRNSMNTSEPISLVSPISDLNYPATTSNDDAFAMNKGVYRRGTSRSRSRSLGRDAARANAVFDHHHSVHYPEHGPDFPPAVGAGALSGAAMMHHQDRRRSPHRHSWNGQVTTKSAPISTPQTMPLADNVPPAPAMRNRNPSPLGSAAPAAAAYNYASDGSGGMTGAALTRSRSNSASSRGRGSLTPNRSQRRSRLSTDDPYDAEYRGDDIVDYNEAPISVANSIVANGRYPNIENPQRRSGEDVRPHSFDGQGARGPGFLQNRQDSSAWQTNQAMPGGWKGTPAVSREASNFGPAQQFHQSQQQKQQQQQQQQPQRQYTMAELRQMEEIEMMARGRKSMEAEWSGRDGYDGFDWHHGIQPQASNHSLGHYHDTQGYGRAL